MADTQKDLPPVPAGTDPALKKVLDRMREAVQVLRAHRGDPLDAAVTWREAIAKGLAVVTGGSVASGGGGVIGPAPPDIPVDLTAPPVPTGLTVSAAVTRVIIEWDAPVYTQGHGNGQTNVYAKHQDPGDLTLPVFSDAVLVGSAPLDSTILVLASEPYTKWHVWIKYQSADGVESTSPEGGTNGVAGTTGQIDASIQVADASIDDAKIGSVSAGKLIAGSIAVGQYIQSTGYVAGVSGWKINGNGVAEFSGVIVRGTIVATGGSIGGATISSSSVQSVSYVAGSAGWKLDNAAGVVYAASLQIQDSTGTRIINTDATGTAYVLQFGTSMWVKANGDAFFGGKLKVGIASDGVITGTGVAVSSNGSSVTSIQTATTTVLTVTTQGGDLQVNLTVNAAVMCNTNTPVEMIVYVLLDGTLYGAVGDLPQSEFTLTNSNPMKLAAGSGATPYNWGATVPFSYPFTIPAADVPAGTHTIAFEVVCNFWTASGTGNLITGCSLYARGKGSCREYLA